MISKPVVEHFRVAVVEHFRTGLIHRLNGFYLSGEELDKWPDGQPILTAWIGQGIGFDIRRPIVLALVEDEGGMATIRMYRPMGAIYL